MQVLKFGGSSVASATSISQVLDIVGDAVSRGPVILVCSAIKGCTDALLRMAGATDRKSIAAELWDKHAAIIRRLFTGAQRDAVAKECEDLFWELMECPAELCQTYGELFSTLIIAAKLKYEGFYTLWIDSRELIDKDDLPGTYERIAEMVRSKEGVQVFVAPGFIAHDASGAVTTLGRGGSDYSAAIYAAGAGASTLEIWTDVPGIMTANPKDVPPARTVPYMSYREALDMARFGAKVLYPPTVQPAMEKGIEINIRDTFEPGNPGTLIAGGDDAASVAEGSPQAAERWLGVTSQAMPDGRVRIALVGRGYPENACARAETTLRQEGIGFSDCTLEGTNLFVTVAGMDGRAALRALHREYFEGRTATDIDIYIAGFGAVSHALLSLIESSREMIAAKSGKNVRVAGLSDSRNFVIDREGLRIPLSGKTGRESVSELFAPERCRPASGGGFAEAVAREAARHSVFVDVTDSESLYKYYDILFGAGISVVTSNRRSLAVPFAQYAAMKASARENGVEFRYETTVGASLPMLSSLSRSVNSSDEVLSIEAVVSCSMNLLLGGLSGRKFSQALYEAFLAGLTESDPRLDLGGVDVLRKLLILGREAGIPLEASDVEVVPMLPREYFDLPLDEFFARLQQEEPHFEKSERFVGEIVRDASVPLGYRARIALKKVDSSHPAYRLRGTDNAILICSAFHPTPLVIEGEGEGARNAAASVLGDILLA